jgi:hypothetical protein
VAAGLAPRELAPFIAGAPLMALLKQAQTDCDWGNDSTLGFKMLL